MMKACIGVKKVEDLWVYQGPCNENDCDELVHSHANDDSNS